MPVESTSSRAPVALKDAISGRHRDFYLGPVEAQDGWTGEEGYRPQPGQDAPDSTLSRDYKLVWRDTGENMPPYSKVRGGGGCGQWMG